MSSFFCKSDGSFNVIQTSFSSVPRTDIKMQNIIQREFDVSLSVDLIFSLNSCLLLCRKNFLSSMGIKLGSQLRLRGTSDTSFTESIWWQRWSKTFRWRAPSRGRRCAPPARWSCWSCCSAARDECRSGTASRLDGPRWAKWCYVPSRGKRNLQC